jgi:hypothetical protein
MDLHTFSRGMAYAAITCALAEVRQVLARGVRGGSKGLVLTIITGRNVAVRTEAGKGADKGSSTYSTGGSSGSGGGSGSASSSPQALVDDDDNDKAYTLTDEIQRVLIEDFYPPISSSTVPGNPGRLYVTLAPAEENKSS